MLELNYKLETGSYQCSDAYAGQHHGYIHTLVAHVLTLSGTYLITWGQVTCVVAAVFSL